MIREIIRLKSEKFSNSRLARALNLSRPTVIKYVKQIEGSGFKLEELASLSDAELHELFEGIRPGNYIPLKLKTYLFFAGNQLVELIGRAVRYCFQGLFQPFKRFYTV